MKLGKFCHEGELNGRPRVFRLLYSPTCGRPAQRPGSSYIGRKSQDDGVHVPRS